MMADLHTYVRDGIEMKKITTYERTLERLLEQTTECAYFIAEYRKIKHFSKFLYFESQPATQLQAFYSCHPKLNEQS